MPIGFITPKKRFSQNFLVNKNLACKLCHYAICSSSDTILEIGPGMGALTGELIKSRKNIISIEIDDRAIDYLKKKFGVEPNFTLIKGDFLNFDIPGALNKKDKICVIGNLPYKYTSLILLKLVKNNNFISSAFLMVQKEVGHRIISMPGTYNYSFLSVILQSFCSIRQLAIIKAGSFRPVPRVDSSFLSFDFFQPPPLASEQCNNYIKLLNLAFMHRRKIMAKNLRLRYDPEKIAKFLLKNNLSLSIRAQELPWYLFLELFKELKTNE